MPDTTAFAATNWSQLQQRSNNQDVHYDEFLRVPDLSAGRYHLPAGSRDPQLPHNEDEVYYVVAGRSRFMAGDAEVAVGPGSVLYVPKKMDHRFFDIEEDLEILVLFAPAETKGETS